MDKLKNMAGNVGSLQDYLDGIQFPIQKDQLADQLQQKGAPDPIVEKVRNADLGQFKSVQDVLGQIPGMR